MRKIVLLALVFLAACQTKQSRHNDSRVFRMNMSAGSLESLDPAYAKDLYSMWVTHMIYSTLVETDEKLHIVPSLAESWNISEDGLRYTFQLRPDVLFQDNRVFPGGKGRALKASDVVFSLKRLIDPKVASSGAWIFNGRIDRDSPFVALDDRHFQLRLRAPFQPMLSMLSMPYCSIVPPELVKRYGKSFRRHPCGTGPFQFFIWDEGNALLLHKNPNYWEQDAAGEKLPYLDAVQLSFYDSKATEFLLFLQGKLDFVDGIDGSFKDLVLTREGDLKPSFIKKYRLNRSTYLNTEYIGFLTDSTNALLRQSPLRYRLVRQAINYAIDRKRIVTYFRNGVGTPATAGFIPVGLPGYDPGHRYGYDYNPAKAAKLLEKAGFPQGKGLGPITILSPDNWADIVNFIATELAEVGIQARTEVMQPNILRQQMSNSQALAFRAQWIADYPDAESYLAVFYSRLPAPPNYTRFRDTMFDAWYERSMTLPDSTRWIRYRKMDSLAMSQAPVVPLLYGQLLHFTQKNVQGFSANPMNLLELKRVKKN